MEVSATEEVVLRAAVDLDPDALAAIEARLAELIGHEAHLTFKRDPSVRGAVLILDEQRQIRIDPDAMLVTLENQLARLPSESSPTAHADSAEAVIRAFDPAPARIADTNLRMALAAFKGDRVTLVTRFGVDERLAEQIAQKLTAASEREILVDVRTDPRAEAGACLLLGSDRRLVLDDRYQFLDQFEHGLSRRRELAPIEPGELSSVVRQAIESTEPELRIAELLDTGSVIDVGDGIASVSGLRGVGSQELLEFENGVYGLAFSLNADRVGCVLLGPEREIGEGSPVRCTGHLLKVPVGDALSGRVVDSLGQPVDEAGPIEADAFRPAERAATGIVDRQPVDVPLHTGTKAIDALVPLGRGQRELIIGDRKIGKTTLAVDAILSQKNTGVRCIYAAIGQKASAVKRVVRVLEENGALEYTTVVLSLPAEQPALRYMTPYTACAIGEYFMDTGRDALVVYDDLSKHAVTYREMSALLERPSGREAYPGDVFYIHSRLLERAGHMSDELGGGTLTALPIVETQAGDISAFIPTNVVSICDGQIFLATSLFNEGYRPALDVGLSVSRVGGAAQTPAMKKVAGRLRIDLAQYHEMSQFVKFGAEVDEATLRQLQRGERARELLKQPQHASMRMGVETAVLYAVTSGLLDTIEVASVRDFERDLVVHLEERCGDLIDELEQEGSELAFNVEARLDSTIAEFVGSWREA